MKKSILILSLLFPVIAFGSIDSNLKYGAHGQEVTELQEFLIDKGFLQTQATGNFYSLTNKAVLAYQTSVSLPSTGFVGPMTREKINAELDTQVADNAQAQETGSVTPALVSVSPDTKALQDQIATLQTALANLTAQQKAQTDQTNAQIQQTNSTLSQIQQNTTPVQSFGSTPVVVDNSPVPTTLNVSTQKMQGNYPYNWFMFNVSIFDQNGNTMHDKFVHMDNPSDNLYQSAPGDFDVKTGSCTSPNCLDALKNNPAIAKDFVATFQYMSTTTGSHTITFTSGNLSTSTTIQVQ